MEVSLTAKGVIPHYPQSQPGHLSGARSRTFIGSSHDAVEFPSKELFDENGDGKLDANDTLYNNVVLKYVHEQAEINLEKEDPAEDPKINLREKEGLVAYQTQAERSEKPEVPEGSSEGNLQAEGDVVGNRVELTV